MCRCDVEECGDKVCVASFNDGKGHAAEEGISIEGWIHSKKRNRLGQDLVERLVCKHTNLQL